jgi:hypothetical protein
MANSKAVGVAYSDPVLNGGTIDNTPIGATTPSTVVTTQLSGALGYTPIVNTVDISNSSAAINATATATAAQIATGYITSTSAAATTITLPTGTLLGAALNAKAGTTFSFWVDNTAGANTVTMAVAVNGILSAAAAAGAGAGAGLLTVPSGVTGLGQFTLVFSSATAYAFSRTA